MVLFYPFPYSTFQKEVSMRNPHLRSRMLCSISVRVAYLHKLFGIFPCGRFFCSPIYSSSHLYQYKLIELYFILWATNNLYLLCCLNCSNFGPWVLFRWLPCPLDKSPLLSIFFCTVLCLFYNAHSFHL